jgi:hypothetical protein
MPPTAVDGPTVADAAKEHQTKSSLLTACKQSSTTLEAPYALTQLRRI